MPDLKKYKAALDAARQDAQEKHAAFVKARDHFHAEGHDLTDEKSEAFLQIEGVHREKAEADQKAALAEQRYVSLLEMEGVTAPKFGDMDDRSEKLAEVAKTAADVVLSSPQYKALVDSGILKTSMGKVSMDPVAAVPRAQMKALITGLSSTSAGSFVIDDRQGGFVEIPRRPRRMLDLVTVGETDSDMVEYVRMTARTNSAAETPEATSTSDAAAVAPESSVAFEVVQEAVKEIKHFIPATRRAMADAGQMATIINAELVEGVLERIDTQIAAGNGTGENVRGILNTAGIQSQTIGSDSMTDAAHKAMTKVRLAYYEPDALAVHPLDWEAIRLSKDANGQYLYGPPSVSDVTTIWGLSVVPTVAVPEDNPVVGAFKRGATAWLREGVQLASTDSHDDWFLKGILAVLASGRLAFGVQRPLAFCELQP